MPLQKKKSAVNEWSSKAGSIINLPYIAVFFGLNLVVLFQKDLHCCLCLMVVK